VEKLIVNFQGKEKKRGDTTKSREGKRSYHPECADLDNLLWGLEREGPKNPIATKRSTENCHLVLLIPGLASWATTARNPCNLGGNTGENRTGNTV